MPIHGGLTPGFERYGGGTPALKLIVESLCAQRGTLIDATQPSNVYLENLANARAIAECWSNNQRMANQWDPARMTEFIPRWEKILALHPADGETDTERRTRIAIQFARINQSGIYQVVYDALTVLLGDLFVEITTTPSTQAVVWTPSGWSVGTTDPTGVLNFYSTVAHIVIRVSQPLGMTDGKFYSTVATINPVLDNLLPAWVTWDWSRATNLHIIPIASSTNATPIVVTTGNLAAAGVQHGFVVGQSVTIAQHLVNTAANGTWVISAVGGTTAGGTGTTLTLTGSVGNGVGGATGTVTATGFYLDGDPSIAGTSGTLVNLDNEALTA